MTAELSKLATALTLIFIISLVTLVAELIYVLWRRRRRTQCMSLTDSSPAFASSSSSISSKHLLYFFCLNNRDFSRVEPKSVTLPNPNSRASLSTPDDEMEVIDVFKLQNMYGPSRILFTIKEDDKEKEVDVESDNSNSVCSSSDRFNLKPDDRENPLEVKMDVPDYPDGVEYSVVGEIEITPFSTPCNCDCESPLYFTPAASPGQFERSG